MKLKVVFESEAIKSVYMDGGKKFAWSAGNSAIDMRSVEDTFEMQPFETRLVDSGFRLQIVNEDDQVGWFISSRSGMASKGILCHLGIIDHSYTGIAKVCLTNLSGNPFKIEFGDRIAQLFVTKIEKPEIEVVSELNKTDRGDNAFGSSGVK
jgi:dUTP pyrophosphatase